MSKKLTLQGIGNYHCRKDVPLREEAQTVILMVTRVAIVYLGWTHAKRTLFTAAAFGAAYRLIWGSDLGDRDWHHISCDAIIGPLSGTKQSPVVVLALACATFIAHIRHHHHFSLMGIAGSFAVGQYVTAKLERPARWLKSKFC